MFEEDVGGMFEEELAGIKFIGACWFCISATGLRNIGGRRGRDGFATQ